MANYLFSAGGSGGAGAATWIPQGVTFATVGGIAAGTNLGTAAVSIQTTMRSEFYPSTAPSATMSAPTTAIIEFPLVSPGAVTVTGTSTRFTNAITSDLLQVSINSGAYATFYTEGAVNPSGQVVSSTYTPTFPFTAVSQVSTFDYRLQVADGTFTTNATAVRRTYLYPYLFGSGAAGLTGAQIWTAFTAARLVQAVGNKSLAFTPSSQVYYFCYPASYASLTTITDGNGFNITADWTLRNPISITGTDGTAQNYKVYEYNNLTSTSQTITFTL